MTLFRKLQSASFKMKLVFAFLSLSLLYAIIIGISSNYYYSQAVKKEFANVSHEATNRLNYFLDYYFNEFQRSSSSLIENATIQGWLTSSDYSNEDVQIVENELKHYVALNFQEIKAMFLVSRSKDIVSMNQSFATKASYESEPWYHNELTDKRKLLPTRLIAYPGTHEMPLITMILPIYNKNTVELIGNLVINFSLTEIRKAFDSSKLGESGVFFIMSDQNTVVFHTNGSWNGLDILQTELKQLVIPPGNSAKVETLIDRSYLISAATSELTNWKIVSMVPYEEMAKDLRAATNANLLIFLVMTLLVVWLIVYVSGAFVKPVVYLKNRMRQVAGGDFTVRAELVPGAEEFQQLNHSFNIMVDRLDHFFQTNMSMQVREVESQLKQKEAMLKALQNQINPHLLYNSLGIIKSLAYLEEVPIIEKMAGNLADVYRYTARFSGIETSLREEIVHLQKYLEIIHVRFPLHFQSRMYVNEKFMSSPVVKLTLQPIVENAVKYAIEPAQGRGVIIVSAYDHGQDLIIEIADNGEGIEQDKLEALNRELDKISAHDIPNYEQGESLGITNVHKRLVLRYGPGYGVRIDSFPGKGTVVSLRMPLSIRPAPSPQSE